MHCHAAQLKPKPLYDPSTFCMKQTPCGRENPVASRRKNRNGEQVLQPLKWKFVCGNAITSAIQKSSSLPTAYTHKSCSFVWVALKYLHLAFASSFFCVCVRAKLFIWLWSRSWDVSPISESTCLSVFLPGRLLILPSVSASSQEGYSVKKKNHSHLMFRLNSPVSPFFSLPSPVYSTINNTLSMSDAFQAFYHVLTKWRYHILLNKLCYPQPAK